MDIRWHKRNSLSEIRLSPWQNKKIIIFILGIISAVIQRSIVFFCNILHSGDNKYLSLHGKCCHLLLFLQTTALDKENIFSWQMLVMCVYKCKIRWRKIPIIKGHHQGKPLLHRIYSIMAHWPCVTVALSSVVSCLLCVSEDSFLIKKSYCQIRKKITCRK